MILPPVWHLEQGDGPLVACAIHDGHAVRPEVAELLRLDANQRLREEDPFTGEWTAVAPTRIIGGRSRFEVDLNRPRESCVYRRPEDAWGLDVWKSPLPDEVVGRSLAEYDDFYAELRLVLERLVKRHQRVVVFDLHSYNHRRQGPDRPPADPHDNPEINVGTGTMHRARWARIVDRCLEKLRSSDSLGRQLDVRENVKFKGGHLPRWIHENFAESVCVLALEVKKFFMDEWTGEPDAEQIETLGRVFHRLAAVATDELVNWKRGTAVD